MPSTITWIGLGIWSLVLLHLVILKFQYVPPAEPDGFS